MTRRPPLLRSLISALLMAALLALAGGAQAATFNVTTTADLTGATCGATCSLRQAVGAANAAAGADTIALPAGTFTLTQAGVDDTNAAGDLDITSSLTISGAGAGRTTVNGNGA